jgi:mannose-6-phosphate isomerase
VSKIPVRLKGHDVPKVWGMKNLEPWFKPIDREKGREIGEVCFQAGGAPVIVKFIFTGEPLSVQVHPDGNLEMWHILNARRGARIAVGFKKPISRDELRRACQSKAILNRLAWYPAHAGDSFLIPARTVHAIGPGLMLCEVKQWPDIGYRLYDHGRSVIGRELTLEDAIRVSRRGPFDPHQTSRQGVVASCRHFTVSKVRIARHLNYPLLVKKSAFLIVLDGQGAIEGTTTRRSDVWYVKDGSSAFSITGSLVLLQVQWKTTA